MNSKEYLKIAVKAAKAVAPTFTKSFGKPKQVTEKGDFRNLVTEIDFKLEQKIRKIISQNFPTHKVIGEELGWPQNVSKQDTIWILDPIDGTTNYIQGLPFCCISIAVWDHKGPLVGCVYSPLTNELFTAIREQGAQLNGKKIHVSQANKLQKAFGGFGWGRDVAAAKKNLTTVIEKTKKIRTLGSTTLEMCLVAKGAYDFHYQTKISVWDFAASSLIVTEAGGKVSDSSGKNITTQTTSILTSNGKIHKELVSLANL